MRTINMIIATSICVITIVGSVLILFVSADQITQVTLGISGICFACYLGIMARLAQASLHQSELLQAMKKDL